MPAIILVSFEPHYLLIASPPQMLVHSCSLTFNLASPEMCYKFRKVNLMDVISNHDILTLIGTQIATVFVYAQSMRRRTGTESILLDVKLTLISRVVASIEIRCLCFNLVRPLDTREQYSLLQVTGGCKHIIHIYVAGMTDDGE